MKHKETLPEQVQAFLQEQQMVQAGNTICCALSRQSSVARRGE